MSISSGQSARQLEHEADDTRRRLSATLDDLADKLTPGRMLDEVIAYSRNGGASFLKGLGNAASTNPLPTLLIGVGAAMFLSGKGRLDSIPRGFSDLFGRSNGGDATRDRLPEHATPRSSKDVTAAGDAGKQITDAAPSAASGVKAAASSVRDAVSDTANRISEEASDAIVAAKDSAVGLGESVGEFAEKGLNAVGEEAAQLRDQARRLTHDARDRAIKLAEEQPLIVAVAGIALGAILAAALPRTKLEDELMGETSDTVKETAGEIASEQIDKISTEAEKVVEEVKDTITEHGLTAEAAVAVVEDAGERVSAALSPGARRRASRGPT
jgi:hypothetical protein